MQIVICLDFVFISIKEFVYLNKLNEYLFYTLVIFIYAHLL